MKKRYPIACVVAFLLVSNYSTAQIHPALDAELQHTLDSMRVVLNTKSLSAAIQTSDGSIWAHSDGISAFATDVTPDDAYLIGSVAKTLTSACILQLADDGLLNIDDSLHEWLPTMPYIDTNITIRQLMNHTSGIYDVLNNPNHYDSLMADMSRIWTPEELIDRFISPPLFAPGASWSYSNTNYFILGMIIREASGNEYYTELRNRFFTPLGLSTFAIPAHEVLDSPVAHVWIDLNGDGILDDGNNFFMSYMSLNSTAGAAGGYFSTPTDCTKWMRSYMRGDVISSQMMDEAQTTVSVGGNIEQYGLGLMHKNNGFLGYEAYGHGGDLAYHASSWYFPELDQSITVFNNDNSKNSWQLIPVVRELLRTYTEFSTASLDDPATTMNLQVSPNPFTNQISVSWNGDSDDDISVSLLDAFGRTLAVQSAHTPTNNRFESRFDGLDTLPGGVYFVRITNNNNGQSTTVRLIK